MKKIAKLSLVAAVAVVGFTSANAQSLEEAIKGVETSGSVVYRYNDYKNDVTDATKTNTNNYKAALSLSSKVNDDVKVNTRFIVGAPTTTTNGSVVRTGDNGFATLDSSDNGDQNVDLTLSEVYFGYTGLKNTTVNVGKQGLATPWTVAKDINGNEQTGTGILALSTIENITLAGAYFNQTNLDDSGTGTTLFGDKGAEDIATIGAIAAVGPVTLDAWYLDAQDLFDSYTIGAKAATDLSGVKLGVDARFTSLTTEADADNSLAKIALTAKAGIFDAKVAYATTDKDGGIASLDNDATTDIQGWSVSAGGKADADFYQAVAGVDILSNLNLSANYVTVDYVKATADVEEEEIYAQLLYKMSKNLTTYVRYGTYTNESTTLAGVTTEANDDVRGRLQVAYTF
jgi:hypothetical protein